MMFFCNINKVMTIYLGLIVFISLFIIVPLTITMDYSDKEAMVKIQEVGTRYAFMFFGEQAYIKVQNVYSEQYASSSESWETCISKEDLPFFKDAKDTKSIINVKVKGYGLSTVFTCITGNRVIEKN